MNGVNIAEACHTVLVVPAVNTTGGVTGQAFSMKQAEHVSIIIAFAAVASPPVAPTSIVINQCTSAAGANATPLASFRYYYQLLGGAGNDILNGAAQSLANTPSLPPNYTTSTAGITSFPATVANLVYIIEIDAAELEAIADVVGTATEYPYLQVVIANGATATFGTCIAILSGLRYAYKIGASQTV
jgi:hypothetical protein